MREESVVSSLDFSPYVPLDWLTILALICLGIFLFALWRRGRGTLLRGTLMALLLLILANPVLLTEKRKFLDDIAVIVLDESNSQKIGRRGETASAAYSDLKSELEAIENLNVETVIVKNKTTSLLGDEDGTHAFDARREALENIPPDRIAATIFITDGQIHDVPETEGEAKEAGPVHFLLTGEVDEKDRVLRVVKAPTFGIVNQPLQFVIKIEDFGVAEPIRSARVTIAQDGEEVARTWLKSDRNLFSI